MFQLYFKYGYYLYYLIIKVRLTNSVNPGIGRSVYLDYIIARAA